LESKKTVEERGVVQVGQGTFFVKTADKTFTRSAGREVSLDQGAGRGRKRVKKSLLTVQGPKVVDQGGSDRGYK